MYDALLDELEDEGTPSPDDAVDIADKDDLDDDDMGEELAEADLDADADARSDELLLVSEEGESWSDDPVRMYLTQMGEIPLLTRKEEIALAKEIEITRARFRRKLLECDFVIQDAVKVLRRVYAGELPFDRTVQVSVTDRLEKEQILGRFPHNLKTLDTLLRRNRRDYYIAVSKSRKPSDRHDAWRRLGRRRLRAVRLVEELGLRTQRIESRIRTLEHFSRRVDELKQKLHAHKGAKSMADERRTWLAEYRNILRVTQETP
ncbi:MAG TPA: sigma-70 factor domain-containing protein, partial [Pirellulales bacterium]|nr:sigma-70 factor domain-containing protein [Pirellulales bacterium]